MKTLIIILILASFLQTTILPIDLVLLILICRAYIKTSNENLYLAFAFGLFNSQLDLSKFGILSLIYLVAIQITQILQKSQLAGNQLMILPVSFILLSASQFFSSILKMGIFDLSKIVVASVLSLPILLLVRLWEERFVVRKEIKLKI